MYSHIFNPSNYAILVSWHQRQNNKDRSHSYRASASPGNVVLARPSTFVGCVLLLPSNVKTYIAGFAFF